MSLPVLHDVVFHDGLRLGSVPLLAGLVVEDLDLRTHDPLGAVESIVPLDLGVVAGLAADLDDLGAVRERLLECLGRLLAGHRVVDPGKEVTVLLVLRREVR